MKRFGLTLLTVCLLVCNLSSARAQDITQKLGGTGSNDEFTVADSNSQALLVVQGNGLVGVGRGFSNPSAYLHVKDSLGGLGGALAIFQNQSTASNADALYVKLGTVTPGTGNRFASSY